MKKETKKIIFEGTQLKPIVTEKAVMMIERDNALTFQTSMKKSKDSIKNEVEEIFDVKIKSIRTLIRKNKKYAYIKLKGDVLAIDVATKLGLM
ncbi:50S ribosomal protein L23 [archaeon]|nr:50S ribosomal protein L23 [archaeon]PJC45213.1 MAG: 50S ribosomal protein L23 [Candidatus Pacearchaeota archaeon CG_4_9_14_0_2_um_filter_30_8]